MIGVAALLHHVQGLPVLRIVRLHLAGKLIILPGLVQPAPAVGNGAHQEIPLGALVSAALQKLLRRVQIAHVDILAHLRVNGGGLDEE